MIANPSGEGLLKNISQKCLKHWNAVVSTSVDERNNANQHSSSTKIIMTGSKYKEELKIVTRVCQLHQE